MQIFPPVWNILFPDNFKSDKRNWGWVGVFPRALYAFYLFAGVSWGIPENAICLFVCLFLLTGLHRRRPWAPLSGPEVWVGQDDMQLAIMNNCWICVMVWKGECHSTLKTACVFKYVYVKERHFVKSHLVTILTFVMDRVSKQTNTQTNKWISKPII